MENTLISKDRLDFIAKASKSCKEGVLAEVGVYKGGSLKLIADKNPGRVIFGFDTFEGLPEEQWSIAEIHQPKEFSDTSLEAVEKFINNKQVRLFKGLFPQSAEGLENHVFGFVHIDTDFYEAVKQSLEWFWPRMIKNGIIVFDDYNWPNCPGVKKALEEFGQPIHPAAKFQAYIIKP